MPAVIEYEGQQYDLETLRSLLGTFPAEVRTDRFTHVGQWERCCLDPAGTLERFFNNPPNTNAGKAAFRDAREIAYRVLGTMRVLYGADY